MRPFAAQALDGLVVGDDRPNPIGLHQVTVRSLGKKRLLPPLAGSRRMRSYATSFNRPASSREGGVRRFMIKTIFGVAYLLILALLGFLALVGGVVMLVRLSRRLGSLSPDDLKRLAMARRSTKEKPSTWNKG